MAVASVIIPAHNEARVIVRTLSSLLEGAAPGEFEILVVCNGCTDGTADVVRRAIPTVKVLEVPEPSKFRALRAGDLAATVIPRVYLDADVAVGSRDVRALLRALGPNVQAAVPIRQLDMGEASRIVRWYYSVWERLPQVHEGAFGRGIIAVSDAGYQRIRVLPEVMSDDLAFAEALGSGTRIVDDAVVNIRVPRTTRALVRRRIRVATGNAQADAMGWRSARSRSSVGTLVKMLREQPRSAPRIVVFLAIALLGRAGARRAARVGDYTTWLRDDTSR